MTSVTSAVLFCVYSESGLESIDRDGEPKAQRLRRRPVAFGSIFDLNSFHNPSRAMQALDLQLDTLRSICFSDFTDLISAQLFVGRPTLLKCVFL